MALDRLAACLFWMKVFMSQAHVLFNLCLIMSQAYVLFNLCYNYDRTATLQYGWSIKNLIAKIITLGTNYKSLWPFRGCQSAFYPSFIRQINGISPFMWKKFLTILWRYHFITESWIMDQVLHLYTSNKLVSISNNFSPSM